MNLIQREKMMKIYLVGGAVRDQLLGLPIKEQDYVVVGATVEDMLKLGYRLVGKEFPVFLHPKTGEEYALARTERKINPGYKGFLVDTSPEVTLAEDLKRRDLTINAMAIDLATHQLIDPYGGQHDIAAKVLKHVSSAFGEDPVRILRVGRFWARFAHLGFTIHEDTLKLMQNMVAAGEVDALVAERVFKELKRAITEPDPQKFFEVLTKCGALSILFPHLTINGEGVRALQMSAKHHDDPIIRFAVLLHAYPEHQKTSAKPKEAIAKLCHRYRVPNAYRELAQLTATHFQTALNAKQLSPDDLLKFLTALDIFRRKIRFKNFLEACLIIALSRKISFDAGWLRDCAKAIDTIDVQALISQGYAGTELAQKLKENRLAKIDQWLRHSQ